MMLLTLDEAREAVASSAMTILDQARCGLDLRVFLVWGAGPVDGLGEADNKVAWRHRALLDHLIKLGYEHEAIEEIEGCCSAAGVGDDEDDRLPATRSPEDRLG